LPFLSSVSIGEVKAMLCPDVSAKGVRLSFQGHECEDEHQLCEIAERGPVLTYRVLTEKVYLVQSGYQVFKVGVNAEVKDPAVIIEILKLPRGTQLALFSWPLHELPSSTKFPLIVVQGGMGQLSAAGSGKRKFQLADDRCEKRPLHTPHQEIIAHLEQACKESVDLLSQGRFLLDDADLQSLSMNAVVTVCVRRGAGEIPSRARVMFRMPGVVSGPITNQLYAFAVP
jgi:hypothetical protein